jgi:hypothetical protein
MASAEAERRFCEACPSPTSSGAPHDDDDVVGVGQLPLFDLAALRPTSAADAGDGPAR